MKKLVIMLILIVLSMTSCTYIYMTGDGSKLGYDKEVTTKTKLKVPML
jgi:hypothetical protein